MQTHYGWKLDCPWKAEQIFIKYFLAFVEKHIIYYLSSDVFLTCGPWILEISS